MSQEVLSWELITTPVLARYTYEGSDELEDFVAICSLHVDHNNKSTIHINDVWSVDDNEEDIDYSTEILLNDITHILREIICPYTNVLDLLRENKPEYFL